MRRISEPIDVGQMSNEEHILISVQRAAELLGCSYWTAREMALSGELPLVRLPSKFTQSGVGRRLRVRVASPSRFAFIRPPVFRPRWSNEPWPKPRPCCALGSCTCVGKSARD
jgi:hypothetical protein